MRRAATVLILWSVVAFVAARVMDRILGGTDANIEELPYQVSLVYYGEHICGGAIIKEGVILSCAHCLDNIHLRGLKVRSGSTYTSSGTMSFVANVTLHPSYLGNENDIALLWLEKPLAFGGFVAAVQLTKQDVEPSGGSMAKVSGWGYLSSHGPNAYHLKVANVPIIDRKVCEDLYFGHVHQNMICAGYPDGEVDACSNDSGGPLVLDGLLVGLTSWGVACGLPNYPGVYTNVAYFREWIDGLIA